MDQNREIEELRRELRQKDRTIAGMKHYLKIAAEYKAQPAPSYSEGGLATRDINPLVTLERTVEGIQAALGKAAAYEGRDRGRKR